MRRLRIIEPVLTEATPYGEKTFYCLTYSYGPFERL